VLTTIGLKGVRPKSSLTIRRNPLAKSDELTLHIAEASQTATVEDYMDWIKHAKSYWDRCLPNLK
jgi:hypothetical protein